ncbi:MAG: FadR family transcriptional regulator [Deltaproteobacteria bacterium]|nr:FadR family transcriptional regulator [Deltaproteobacteria bacterium]
MEAAFTPLNSHKNFERIFHLLKEKIFTGEYIPGDRLPTERELAEMLKVSRLSVREAYRALALFRIIEIRRGKKGGAFIQRLKKRSVAQSMAEMFRLHGCTLSDWIETRLIIERDIAKLAVQRHNKRDLNLLAGWLKKASDKLQEGELATRENVGFDLCLADISRNPILIMTYGSIMDLLLNTFLVLVPTLEISRAMMKDHAGILKALESGKTERMLSLVSKHVRASNKRLMALADRAPLFSVNTGFKEALT